MNIKVPEPFEKSKSRKVNKYVKLHLTLEALRKQEDFVRSELTMVSMHMTGGQLGEAQRILKNDT